MGKTKVNPRLVRILECAEAHFKRPVQSVTAPGGEGRSSYRLHFDDLTVIATLRPNFRRTHLEGFVLDSLAQHCDDAPKCLGVVGEIMFQSDVGSRRLNQDIMRHNKAGKIKWATDAIAGIFRIQNAARKTTLHETLPHLGANDEWTHNFVYAADALQRYSGGISINFDRDAACTAIARAGTQFVKWDCRSGNAAIGDDDRLRWFDFEYSGLRHGAEDVAWLIGDEAWPLSPDIMFEIVSDCFDPDCGYEKGDYLDYLAVYLTFHCVQRFKLITKEAQKRGWLSKERVRKYDDAGLHPEFAAQICNVGRFCAERSPLTAPLARNFDAAMHGFRALLKKSDKRKTA